MKPFCTVVQTLPKITMKDLQKLTLKAQKTERLLVLKASSTCPKFNIFQTERVYKYKCLDIWVNDKRTFNSQINHCVKKIKELGQKNPETKQICL